MITIRTLLFPLALLYDLITRVRNYLYDIGHKKSFRFETTVISVGNLNVGGSGKTPMVEYLINLLTPGHTVATLSRGYGRSTKGFRMATAKDSADTLGDEPFQLFRKFGPAVRIAVGEDRAFAIPNILHQLPTADVIVLDDAFQHRSVSPQFSILVTDFSRPFYDDHVLPAGNLREARYNARRCDVVVVTKCPIETAPGKYQAMEKSIHRFAPDKPVFFSGLRYGTPVSFGSENHRTSNVVLVSAIADSRSLEAYVGGQFSLLQHFAYRDHHRYSLADLRVIHEYCNELGKPVNIITTEKDMVKLLSPSLADAIASMPWSYLPVAMSFLRNGSEFDSMVLRSIQPKSENA